MATNSETPQQNQKPNSKLDNTSKSGTKTLNQNEEQNGNYRNTTMKPKTREQNQIYKQQKLKTERSHKFGNTTTNSEAQKQNK